VSDYTWLKGYVGFVELVLNGRCIGSASFDWNKGGLWSEVTLRKPPGPKVSAWDCQHPEPVAAWAVLMNVEAEYRWPMRYCPECRTVVDGDVLWPPVSAPLEVVIAYDAWRAKWFKSGKPRRPAPPDNVTWPELDADAA